MAAGCIGSTWWRPTRRATSIPARSTPVSECSVSWSAASAHSLARDPEPHLVQLGDHLAVLDCGPQLKRGLLERRHVACHHDRIAVRMSFAVQDPNLRPHALHRAGHTIGRIVAIALDMNIDEEAPRNI